MKSLGMFLLRVFGVVLIILFAFWVGSKIWAGVAYSECICEEVSTTPDVGDSPAGDVTFTQEEKVCRFAEDYTSEGQVVPAGTKVVGPAFVKPDRDLDWAKPIYVDEEYVTEASDEVIWLLNGDNACVDAQSQFFSHWGTEPTN